MSTSVSPRSFVDRAQWAQWNSESRPYSVGVEEEVMLLDPTRRWAPAQRIDDVLEMLPGPLAGSVSAETHQAAIELRTDPHESVGRAVAQLRRQRGELFPPGRQAVGTAGAETRLGHDRVRLSRSWSSDLSERAIHA